MKKMYTSIDHKCRIGHQDKTFRCAKYEVLEILGYSHKQLDHKERNDS
jgi:hypothetical protein